MKRTIGLLVALVLAGSALAACGGGASDTATAAEVIAVDREAARVTLDHEEIPGLMKAMTMEFDVAEPSQLDGLSPGDPVRFRVHYADGRYTITAIEPR